MTSSHGMKLSLQDDFLFERPASAIPHKLKGKVLKRPHTANPTRNGTPWVNPNALSNTPVKKFNISLNHKKSESRVSKKAPYAPRLKSGTRIWDEPKVINGRVFTKPEYSSLEDPHLKSYFERKLGTKPKLSNAKQKKIKTIRNKVPHVVYSITLVTGDDKNAGTNANVFIQIRGTNGKLSKQKLEKSAEDSETNATNITLPSSSSETFMISSPDIGKLIAFEIEHDGVERKQSWFLERVLIKNQKTKERWTFLCQKWLSLYESDCQVKRILKPLPEEQKTERVIYEVQVMTGNVRGAGTDAHVFLSIYGDHGNTGRVQLVNRNIDTFERGQTDIFKVKVRHLGKLQRIMIDHDNTGFAPGWFLDRITITNLNNPEEKRYFICNKWLSKDEDDGEISRLLLGTSNLDSVVVAHKYAISTFTGDIRGAGTDANVFITLFSKDGSSSEMKLNDSKNNFERKRVDIFQVECPNLGQLTRVRIRHDNKGLAAGWFLDKVEVKDFENNKFSFPCGRWLSVTEDDGQISRDLVIAGSGDDISFGIPYTIHITTGDIRGAGTDAKIYVIMYGGKNGDKNSGKLWVQNGKKNNFSRARTDIFQVECGEQLSPLHHITIGHDNTGAASGWYCEKVVIESPTTGIFQTFFCRLWLADDEGDGLIERELSEDIDYRKKREIKNVWAVTAYTSDIFGAGTDAKVSFVLYGDQGKSEPILLANETNNFERGSIDKFSVDIKDVGIPYKMIIAHDDSKPYSSWHLDKVLLENGQTNERYSFNCGRWLGTDEDDGQCVRELPAAGGKDDPLSILPYKVCVHTGDKYGAGTDSNVFINIFGERGDTGDRPLRKSATNKNKFERKKVDEFIVEAVSMKELKSIRIGHDGKGAGSGWFLNKVVITDPTDNKDYQFLCNRWLASDEDDGHIIREIPVGGTPTLLKTTSYHVSVKTGDIRGAGTDANVYIVLFGDSKDTGKLPLLQAENTKNKWERGRTDMFTVEAMDIGKINKMVIGHDGSGIGAGWFLAVISIEVPSTGQHLTFACNRWLAADEDDGLIERELYPSDDVEISKKIPYEIEIHTGDCSGAGTNADVFIVLYGIQKKSEEFWLRSKSDNFERNRVDRFKIESDEVGVLTKLRVGHDNSGFNSAWFLDKIIVKRLLPPNKPKVKTKSNQNSVKRSAKHRASHDDDDELQLTMNSDDEDDDDCNYIFPCARWLAKNEDDGQIIRDLVPYDVNGTNRRKSSLSATIYTIRVFTGDVKSAGTNSNVFLTIYGDKGDTGERPLKKSDTHYDKFERNQEDVFKIDCINVGTLSKVKVRHDNSGLKSSWFLDKISIHDSTNESEYVFPCNQWLSKTEDDGALSRELVAVDIEEYQRRKKRSLSRAASSARQSITSGNIDLEQMAEKTTYTINVETGDVAGAGTDANVFITLYGEHGDSGKIDLKTSKTNKNKFERKQLDTFTAEAVDLGNLEKIKIGHDNKGGFAGWYLENVVINAPSVGRKWTFPAARWLDKGKEDGKLEVDLYPSAEKEEFYEKRINLYL